MRSGLLRQYGTRPQNRRGVIQLVWFWWHQRLYGSAPNLVFRRALLEHPTLPLQLQLTHPRWVVALGWVVFALAWASLALSAHWQGLPGWVPLLGAALSALVLFIVQRRRHAWLEEHCLCFVDPSSKFAIVPSSFWGTFSKNTGQRRLTPVTLQQHWAHIFGLTLRLNLHNHPHNKAEVVILTLWRSQLPAQVYRRLLIWAAWQSARGTPLSKGEPA